MLSRQRGGARLMLALSEVDLFYGDAQALDRVSLEVKAGEIVAIIGANGAGKSSLIRTIFGMERARGGRIRFEDRDIMGAPPHVICNLGIGQVAEGRQIFPTMTVRENLEMGAVVPRARAGTAAAMARVFALWPRLAERQRQLAGTLSGGEQQMLAIGRCLMGVPRLMMLDEPSLGLAPVVVEDVFRVVRDLNERDGLTIVLVEQNVAQSLALAHRGYVLENGRIVMSGSGKDLLADDRVRKAYVGI
jgi:branched-chain amino acid transport system ATP-binding protein